MTFCMWSKKGAFLAAKVRSGIEKMRADKEDKLQKEEFMQELTRARADLQTARNNYNFAKDPALLEYYIYEIKAAETRLNYFLKLAKENRFSNDGYLPKVVLGGSKRREEMG